MLARDLAENHDPCMSRSDMNEIESSDEPSAVPGVGAITEYRLKRDLDITTVAEVAEADVETLQEVWGVGPVRAGQMKGRSQGVVKTEEERMNNIHEVAKKQYEIAKQAEETPSEEEMDEMWNERGSGEKRVAIVAGQDELDKVSADYQQTLIDLALEKAGVELDDNTRVGWVQTDADRNEMGGWTVQQWYDRKLGTGPLIRKMQFDTPWTKYSYFLWDEWGYDSQPDIERPKLKTEIPFDVARGEDVQSWMAPAERTRDMVLWADEVVIVVDGDYADSYRHKCEQEDVDCTTVFDIHKDNLGGYNEDGQAKVTAYEPPEDETISSHHSKAVPLAQREGDDDGEWEEMDAEVGAYDRSEFDPHQDVDQDEEFHLWSDSHEHRPDGEDRSAGEGVGSASWSDYSPGQ